MEYIMIINYCFVILLGISAHLK